jgi:hypothetical protein
VWSRKLTKYDRKRDTNMPSYIKLVVNYYLALANCQEITIQMMDLKLKIEMKSLRKVLDFVQLGNDIALIFCAAARCPLCISPQSSARRIDPYAPKLLSKQQSITHTSSCHNANGLHN